MPLYNKYLIHITIYYSSDRKFTISLVFLILAPTYFLISPDFDLPFNCNDYSFRFDFCFLLDSRPIGFPYCLHSFFTAVFNPLLIFRFICEMIVSHFRYFIYSLNRSLSINISPLTDLIVAIISISVSISEKSRLFPR